MKSIFITLLPRSFSDNPEIIKSTQEFLYQRLESDDINLLIFLNPIDEWDFFFFNCDNITKIDFENLREEVLEMVKDYFSENSFKKTRKETEQIRKSKVENLF